jgi:hypothetical protein
MVAKKCVELTIGRLTTQTDMGWKNTDFLFAVQWKRSKLKPTWVEFAWGRSRCPCSFVTSR